MVCPILVSMDLSVHFLVSAVLAAAMYSFFGWYSLLIFVPGFLIDMDHYIYYVTKFGKFNLFKARRYFREVKLHKGLFIFHTVEVFVVVLLLAVFYSWGRMLFLGLLVHHAMDIFWEIKRCHMDAKSRSLILYVLKR